MQPSGLVTTVRHYDAPPRIPRRRTITSEEPGVNKFAFILCVAMAWFVAAPRAKGSQAGCRPEELNNPLRPSDPAMLMQ
jgi:hypothetical protein